MSGGVERGVGGGMIIMIWNKSQTSNVWQNNATRDVRNKRCHRLLLDISDGCRRRWQRTRSRLFSETRSVSMELMIATGVTHTTPAE